jgi:hypothetical protein
MTALDVRVGTADLGLPNMRFVMPGCNTSPENWLT